MPSSDCPALAVSPEMLQIEGRIGARVEVALGLANVCKDVGDLTISAITLDDPSGAFTVAPHELPVVLPAGEATALMVGFATANYAPLYASLLIASDDPDSPELVVPLAGTVSPDQDGDGEASTSAGGDDCDDMDATVRPGADEIWYDGVDEDCDGRDDFDADQDGYRTAAVGGGDDCDDFDAGVNPSAEEIWYDGVDQDCSGGSDHDRDGDGLDGGDDGEDCDDDDASVGGPVTEIWYDGVDQDCDGWDDYDADRDGAASADYGGTDCLDADPAVGPSAAEIWYDGMDQDCSGGSDYDQDGDGLDGAAWGGTDCDDTDADAWPGAAETRDLADDDCDGLVDEDFVAEGDVIVSELMVNPKAVSDNLGEYIELYNASAEAVDLHGWTVSGYDGDGFTIEDHLVLEAGAYAVLGASADEATNGGVVVDYDYAAALKLNNGSEEVVTVALEGAIVAELAYDVGWPIDAGEAMGLDPALLEPDAAGSVDAWCAQRSLLPAGDFGTPGAENDLCPAFDHDEDGWTGEDGDCDDADAEIHPGAEETWYDGVDQDCSGGSDDDQDEDGWDAVLSGGADCDDDDAGDGWDAERAGGDDCDDEDAGANPGAEETWYDGVDQDCSGGGDGDQDGDGWDAILVGGDDCDDEDASVSPDASEAWDGVDADCDGAGDDAVVSEVALLALDGEAGDAIGWPQGLGAGDLDGDGVDDVVVGGALAGDEAGGAWVLGGAEREDWDGSLEGSAFAVLSGGVSGNRLGSLGPAQGDLDGDGVDDLALAGSDIAGGAAACVWLGGSLDGALDCGDAWVALYGADDDEIRALSHLDLDGTGIADLVYADLAYSTDRGRVTLIGDADLAGGGVVSMASAYDARVRGAANYDLLGSAVAGGDVDGDGADDLLIGAYGAGSGETGALYLYAASGLGGVADAPSGASWTLTGVGSADRVGESAPALGDLDGDGALDLVVPASGAGEVAVFFDASSLSGSLRTSGADATLSGGEVGLFGAALAVTDLDGDGLAELVVGAPDAATPGSGAAPGELRVFRVRGAGDLSADDHAARLEGEEAGDGFGGALLGGLDLDGDGRGDLLVAAWAQDGGGAEAGRLYGVVLP